MYVYRGVAWNAWISLEILCEIPCSKQDLRIVLCSSSLVVLSFWLLARSSRIQGIGPTSISQLPKICVCFFFFYGMSGGMGEGGTSAGMANDARSGLWAATGGHETRRR